MISNSLVVNVSNIYLNIYSPLIKVTTTLISSHTVLILFTSTGATQGGSYGNVICGGEHNHISDSPEIGLLVQYFGL